MKVLAWHGMALEGREKASCSSPFRHRKFWLASTAGTEPWGQLQLLLAALPPLEQVAAQQKGHIST